MSADLLERVKEGHGPSRELDAEIWLLQQGYKKRGDFNPSTVFWTEERNMIAMAGNSPMRNVPKYTASLDAIVSLIQHAAPEHVDKLIADAVDLWIHDAKLRKSVPVSPDLPRFCVAVFLSDRLDWSTQ